MFVGSYAALSGGSKKADSGPPVNASSKDEENFIQYVQSRPEKDRMLIAG